MISVDTVYQRVLAILNKEQRGYITPQEYNLKANQAQLEIFEQYFYDLQQFKRMRDNNTEYSNMVKLIDEKISKFKKTGSMTHSIDHFIVPSDLHKIGTVIYNNKEVERVDQKEILYLNLSPLAKPTAERPVYVQNIDNTEENLSIKVYPTNINTGITCSYVRKPKEVKWAYTNVDDTALYNANNSIDFELHESEEAQLVIKILAYSGVIVRQLEVTEVAEAKENKILTQEKS
jgi:hypothetical protein